MAPPAVESPQVLCLKRPETKASARKAPTIAMCRMAELSIGIPKASLRSNKSCWLAISATPLLRTALIERLGNDADVGDAGLLYRVHYGGEGSEGNALIGAKINDL